MMCLCNVISEMWKNFVVMGDTREKGFGGLGPVLSSWGETSLGENLVSCRMER